jgi:hypothetical protein
MAMVLTRQKPRQRDRFVVRSLRICRGPQRAWEAWREASGTWETRRVPTEEGQVARHTDLEPRKGKPGHGSRPEPTRPGEPLQPVSRAEQKRGALKTPRESDPPIVLSDGSAGYRGKGRTVLRSLHRKHGPDMKDRRQQCQPPGREERRRRRVRNSIGFAICMG